MEHRPYLDSKGRRMDGYYMKVYFSWHGGTGYCHLAVYDGKQTRPFGGGSSGR